MKNNTMHIFYAINNAYTQHAYVSIISVLKNNQNEAIHFYIMSNDLSEKNKNLFSELEKKFNNCQLTFFDMDESQFSHLKLNISHIGCQTYFRYLIPELAPNLNKALYLDADLVVNDSLIDLWNTDISNDYAAGVRDSYIENIHYSQKPGLFARDLYVNAGVLLLNIQKIRQDNKTKELFLNTKKFENIIEYQDQDIINITFKGKIKSLPQKYNFTQYDISNSDEVALHQACIIHFTGAKKPWDFEYMANAAEKYYYKYLQLTPFQNTFWKKLLNIHKYIFYKKNDGAKRSLCICGIKFKYTKKKKPEIYTD